MSESDPCPTKSHLDCAIPFNGCKWKNGECINWGETCNPNTGPRI